MIINNEEKRKFKEVLDEVLKRFDEKEIESIKLYDKSKEDKRGYNDYDSYMRWLYSPDQS